MTDFVIHIYLLSLNTVKRQREQVQHDNKFQQLQKKIGRVRPSYPSREYQRDYAKAEDVKKRMTRFPLIKK